MGDDAPDDLEMECGCRIICAHDESGEKMLKYFMDKCRDGEDCRNLKMFLEAQKESGKPIEFRVLPNG